MNDTQLVNGLVSICLRDRRATPGHKEIIDKRVNDILAAMARLREERDEAREQAKEVKAEMLHVVGDWNNNKTEVFEAKYGTRVLRDAMRTGPKSDA